MIKKIIIEYYWAKNNGRQVVKVQSKYPNSNSVTGPTVCSLTQLCSLLLSLLFAPDISIYS